MGLVTGQGRPECSRSRTPFKAKLTRFDGAREGAVVQAEGRVTWQTEGTAEKLGFTRTALSDACFPSMSVRLPLPLGQSPRWEALPEAITCLYLCHAQKADSSSTLWLDRAGVIRPDSPKTGQRQDLFKVTKPLRYEGQSLGVSPVLLRQVSPRRLSWQDS